MKQYLDLKVDLENPDEARHTIDELVKMYEEDKLKWTAEELTEAKHLAMKIMEQLCLDGYSIEWCGVTEAYYYKAVSVWLKSPGDESFTPHLIANVFYRFPIFIIFGVPRTDFSFFNSLDNVVGVAVIYSIPIFCRI